MKRILRPGGCILMDSSDLRYLFEEEDGSIVIDLAEIITEKLISGCNTRV